MKSFLINVKKLDLFGKPYIFEEKESQKFTTTLGLLMTFLIIITCIIISFLFGKEIYQRKNPSVVNSEEKIDNSYINMRDFPLLYSFTDGGGFNMPKAVDHITVRTTHMYFDQNLKSNYTFYSGIEKCDASKFQEKYRPYVQSFYESVSGVDIYCFYVGDDMSIQNDYATANSILLNIRFMLCDDSNGNTCGPEDELAGILEDLYISVFYVDAYLDSSNYSNPINYYISTISQKISEGLLQRYFIDIQKLNFISNNGWLLDDKHYENVNSVKKQTKDVSTDTSGNLYWLTLSSPKIRSKVERSYMKVQDMLAKIGGFFNALYIGVLLFSKSYIDFSYYKYVYNHFCTEENNVENAVGNNNPIHSHNSLAKQTTINKLAMKIAYNNIYQNNENKSKININNFVNNNYKSSSADINIKAVHELKPYNNMVESIIKNNSSNKLNNNFIFHEQASKLNISNNNLNNKEVNINLKEPSFSYVNQQQNNNVDNIEDNNNNNNNMIKQESKQDTKNLYLNQNIKNLDNNKKDIPNTALKKDVSHMLKDPKISTFIKKVTYKSYFWNDILCCRNNFLYQKKAVEKVLSFENIVEVSYDYYLKNAKE